MAKRKRHAHHKGHKTYKPKGGKTLYGKCLSKHMRGKHPKSKSAKSKMMKSANRACRPFLCRRK